MQGKAGGGEEAIQAAMAVSYSAVRLNASAASSRRRARVVAPSFAFRSRMTRWY